MAKGDAFPCEATRTRDRASGRTVWRLTGRQAVNHGPYFYNPPVTPDGRRIVFGSDRTGAEQLFMVEWPSGSIIQLTNGREVCAHNAVLAPRGAEVYCFDGPELHAVALASFKARFLACLPEGQALASSPAISSDGQLLVYCCFQRPDVGGLAGWEAFAPTFAARPRTEIWVAPIDGSGATLVHAEDRWLGHPQFRPGDNNTIMYCHEGPWDQVERIWALAVDGAGAPRPLRPQKVGAELVGHEYFTRDGSTLVYAWCPGGGDGGKVPARSVRALDLATGQERVIFEGRRVNHFTSNADNSLIVADTDDPADQNLYLIDARTGSAQLLCACRSSQKTYRSTQDANPHPCFSWDGKFVFFNSDELGWPNFNMAVL
jgi:oligogalacturonide lyase